MNLIFMTEPNRQDCTGSRPTQPIDPCLWSRIRYAFQIALRHSPVNIFFEARDDAEKKRFSALDIGQALDLRRSVEAIRQFCAVRQKMLARRMRL